MSFAFRLYELHTKSYIVSALGLMMDVLLYSQPCEDDFVILGVRFFEVFGSQKNASLGF